MPLVQEGVLPIAVGEIRLEIFLFIPAANPSSESASASDQA